MHPCDTEYNECEQLCIHKGDEALCACEEGFELVDDIYCEPSMSVQQVFLLCHKLISQVNFQSKISVVPRTSQY